MVLIPSVIKSCVSTHSRLKAAGSYDLIITYIRERFNTQPPEGGWTCYKASDFGFFGFQHTAA